MRLLLVCLVCSSLIGCNLATDLDAYPYRGTIIIDLDDDGITPIDMPQTPDMPADLDQDTSPDLADDMPAPDDMPPDMIPDMEPLVIKLRFTEIMADVANDGGTELGEYIEITNTGTQTLDPRRIRVRFDTGQEIGFDLLPGDPEEQAIVDGIKPLLPGQSFVFVRQDTPAYAITAALPPGTFYEHGRWSAPNIALSNDARTIILLYPDPATNFPKEFDRVSWFGKDLVEPNTMSSLNPLRMVENSAWSLNPAVYDEPTPAAAEDWCYDDNLIFEATLFIYGSPGEPLAGPCLRE